MTEWYAVVSVCTPILSTPDKKTARYDRFAVALQRKYMIRVNITDSPFFS